MAEIIYIACPLCGMSRVLEKKGSSAIARGLSIGEPKGRIRFDHMDLDSARIVQVRERKAGRESVPRMGRGGGTGFTIKDGFTLEEMKAMPEYQDLIEQLRKHIALIEKVI
jgi:hypothetical protein